MGWKLNNKLLSVRIFRLILLIIAYLYLISYLKALFYLSTIKRLNRMTFYKQVEVKDAKSKYGFSQQGIFAKGVCVKAKRL